MNQLLKVFILMLALFACDPKKDTSDQAFKAYQDAMKVHDQVMPRMDEMHKLAGQLKLLRASLMTDSVIHAQRISIVREKLSALEVASKDMMDWMHNVQDIPGTTSPSNHAHRLGNHPQTKELNPKEILKIQQEQKDKIEAIKISMERSIEDAKDILANH